jgi:hypothetical protein
MSSWRKTKQRSGGLDAFLVRQDRSSRPSSIPRQPAAGTSQRDHPFFQAPVGPSSDHDSSEEEEYIFGEPNRDSHDYPNDEFVRPPPSRRRKISVPIERHLRNEVQPLGHRRAEDCSSAQHEHEGMHEQSIIARSSHGRRVDHAYPEDQGWIRAMPVQQQVSRPQRHSRLIVHEESDDDSDVANVDNTLVAPPPRNGYSRSNAGNSYGVEHDRVAQESSHSRVLQEREQSNVDRYGDRCRVVRQDSNGCDRSNINGSSTPTDVPRQCSNGRVNQQQEQSRVNEYVEQKNRLKLERSNGRVHQKRDQSKVHGSVDQSRMVRQGSNGRGQSKVNGSIHRYRAVGEGSTRRVRQQDPGKQSNSDGCVNNGESDEYDSDFEVLGGQRQIQKSKRRAQMVIEDDDVDQRGRPRPRNGKHAVCIPSWPERHFPSVRVPLSIVVVLSETRRAC